MSESSEVVRCVRNEQTRGFKEEFSQDVILQ
jgi:hypothetical protein